MVYNETWQCEEQSLFTETRKKGSEIYIVWFVLCDRIYKQASLIICKKSVGRLISHYVSYARYTPDVTWNSMNGVTLNWIVTGNVMRY